ncbi:hypothetical protein [Kocuria sp. KH4]
MPISLPAFPADWTIDSVESVAVGPAITVPLNAGTARILPLWTDTEGIQHTVELPDEPLDLDDLEALVRDLRGALRAARKVEPEGSRD